MIRTARLILRAWREEDAAPHHAMCNDPEVARYLGAPPTLADSRAAVTRQNGFLDSYCSCFWALERRDGGDFIGWCGVTPGPAGTPIANQPEIGWSLARPAWGQGYAIEAARASLAWFWARRDEPGVAAITVLANARSRRLMERLGMIRRVDEDFDHPAVPDDSPLKRHLVYRLARPA